MLSKDQLRQEIFKKRAALTDDYRQAAQAKVYDQLFDLDVFKKAKTIMVYYSTPEEFNTHPIIEKAWQEGKRVGIPRVFPKRVMEALEYTSDSQLENSKFDIPEPSLASPVIDPESIDLIIMPCVSCNNQGERIGYGGGYYDRYLLRAKNAYFLLPYFAKLQSQEIPKEEHDQKVDLVITEEGTFKIS